MNINFRQLTLSTALALTFGLPASSHYSIGRFDTDNISVMRKDSTDHKDSIAKEKSADKAKKDTTAAKKTNAYDKLVKKGGSVRNGLFTVRHIEDKWYFEVPQSITDRMLLAVTRFTSVPQAFKELPGEEVNHSTIYFEKRDDKTLLLRAYAKTQVADAKEQMAQLVEKSTADPIVAKFDIIGKNPKTGDMLVEVSKFFVQDNNIFGLSSSDRKIVNVTALQADRSFVDTMTVYPINVEVKTLRTYSCPDGKMPASKTGFVTIGMNTCNLSENTITGYWFIWRNSNTAIVLHQMTDVVQLHLVYISLDMEMILEYGLNTCQRSIACTLTKAVYAGMNSLAPAYYCSHNIADCHVVVIVGVKVKMMRWIALNHPFHVIQDLNRIQYTQCVRQHISVNRCIFESIHQGKHIFGIIFDTITPILEVDIYIDSPGSCIFDHIYYIPDMLCNSFLQLPLTMATAALT